ncbi:hypothetical protein EDD37DRAFT_609247 [Exophiala viscosa]|uniref:DUF7924 domain-containing protein n=1 Tax=Exophiala viscosa TaxID=2486360 RepID=A0AAN6DYA3_9EURO|nr:hypothetical protein EDD36DRAFT_416397 [Exophiala viscosa]KAI1624242.1 hypothetical protein EDD37DRAFT_609247 [Exophiala viscosa]
MSPSRSASRSLSRPSLHSRQASRSTEHSSMSERKASFGCADYRSATLEPNNIIVEDQQMDDDRWSRLAFALGMPFGESLRASSATTKFAQQIRSQRSVTSREMAEMLVPLLASIAIDHNALKCRTDAAFCRDAVPDEVHDAEIEDGWKMQLPTPKPAITLGYSNSSFTCQQLELQQYIITNNKNEPCDLHQLSQPVPDIYWPFFVVEVEEHSMLAARNACAGSAATCNNALMILAAAAQEPQRHYQDADFLWKLSKAAQSFSLAINGKTACLNTHNSEGHLPHGVATIRSYRLDDEREVEALAARIRSIFVWAENSRLRSICDLLNTFDRKVQMERNLTVVIPPARPGSTDSARSGGQRRRRRSIIRAVLTGQSSRMGERLSCQRQRFELRFFGSGVR